MNHMLLLLVFHPTTVVEQEFLVLVVVMTAQILELIMSDLQKFNVSR